MKRFQEMTAEETFRVVNALVHMTSSLQNLGFFLAHLQR
jgi:hypothetical protein